MENSLEGTAGKLLKEKGLTFSVAESCTGGLLGDKITNISGSSEYFLGGVIAYDNSVKHNVLGVSSKTLRTCGAVSEECAREMAEQIRKLIKTDIGIAVTGVAGPTGGSYNKPIGTVWIGLSSKKKTITKQFLWKGDRCINKKDSAEAALKLLIDYLTDRL